MASRGQPDAFILAAESCASVKKDCVALASSASVGAVWVKPGRGNEISAADAHALGERACQRSDGIVPHELRKERQFGFLLGCA
jgi:hypothetical protein